MSRDGPGLLAQAVAAGDRSALAQAITLIESRRADRAARGQAVLEALLPRAGGAIRLGITGAPGVGKSTLIEALGCRLTAAGHRLAVLAVDPTSARTGGSILGDKTRMARLSADPAAFIRPSPAGGALGGVAQMTREAMLICEAAGYDLVLVETVGVGQSETVVGEMVDCFLVLALPGAGDELQGIKKGIVEHADIVAITKADGGGQLAAQQAVQHWRAALHIIAPADAGWRPPVIAVSALDGTGLDELWSAVVAHHEQAKSSGALDARRHRQAVQWFRKLLDSALRDVALGRPGIREAVNDAEAAVARGRQPPRAAVAGIARLFERQMS